MPTLTDIFRSIFGPPKERLDTSELPRDIQEDFENLYGRGPVIHWELGPPGCHEEWRIYNGHSSEHRDHEHFFPSGEGDFVQEFEQMFQNFFRGFVTDFNLPTEELPPGSQSEVPQDNFPQQPRSLRDRMLKSPDNDNIEEQLGDSKTDDLPSPPSFSLFGDFWKLPFGGLRHPDERADIDLDSEVKMGTQSLDRILAQKGDRQLSQPNSLSSSSSFSSVTIVDSNGVRETKTTRRDSSGKEEVTITRRIGDQFHTVTERKDSRGNEEAEVDTGNLNSGSVDEFNKKWQRLKSGETHPGLSDSSALNPQSSLSSIVESLMENFFPKRR